MSVSTNPCPICHQRVTSQDPYRPFCSSRCQQIDLGQWLGERYVIPGESVQNPQDGSSKEESNL